MNNKKLFKVALAGAIVLFSQVANAQFKFSKVNVADGVKTALKSGDKVDMKISSTGTVEQNFVVDLDIAAFRKAYKYDVVTIAYLRDGSATYQYIHEFESILNTKKYAGKGIIPIYAYDNKKFKETDFRVLAKDLIEYEGPKPVARKVAVYGNYIVGEEGYFDANDKFQFRNKYSEGELLGFIEINTVYNPTQINAYNEQAKASQFAAAQRSVDNLGYRFKRDIMDEINATVAPVVATPVYVALGNGFQEVWDSKVREVQQYNSSENAEKFITMVEALDQDYRLMYDVINKDKSRLKTMNKEIKTKTSVQDKWEYIKSMK
jgi:hypothetical protein